MKAFRWWWQKSFFFSLRKASNHVTPSASALSSDWLDHQRLLWLADLYTPPSAAGLACLQTHRYWNTAGGVGWPSAHEDLKCAAVDKDSRSENRLESILPEASTKQNTSILMQHCILATNRCENKKNKHLAAAFVPLSLRGNVCMAVFSILA